MNDHTYTFKHRTGKCGPDAPCHAQPVSQEDVPQAARAAFTCKHEFKVFDPLDEKSIDVYCGKCGTTVSGNRIIPPVAYASLHPAEALEDKEEGWAEEFDRVWPAIHQGCDDGYYACPKSEDYFGHQDKLPIEERPCECDVEHTRPKVKSFITTLLAQVAEESREKALEDAMTAVANYPDTPMMAVEALKKN